MEPVSRCFARATKASPILAGVALSIALLASAPLSAAAEPTRALPASSTEDPTVEPSGGNKREAAPDERTGHIYLAGNVGATGALGTVPVATQAVTVATPLTDLVGPGLTAGGILGIGVSRHATLQLFGDYTAFSRSLTCVGPCAGRSFAAGLGLTYHLAQGLALDPWGSYGIAFRQATFDAMESNDLLEKSRVFRGLDIARIALGGDFYPTPHLGVGLFVEGDFGTFLRMPVRTIPVPTDTANGGSVYAHFQIGLRIVLDPLRRSPAPTPQGWARSTSSVAPPGGI